MRLGNDIGNKECYKPAALDEIALIDGKVASPSLGFSSCSLASEVSCGAFEPSLGQALIVALESYWRASTAFSFAFSEAIRS